ncbi:hypothetical protein [Brucella anthropi]|uniref:hypothetical protein n=1 Tax=Brucella anthropi TaxID=529 RepID=UPI00124C62FE|nr:hypothetical protein [Brucella anthropi]KAB2781200.1 hypothetical protein F9K99_08290 [Brucella anthropi]
MGILKIGRILFSASLATGIGTLNASAQDQSWREKAVTAIIADNSKIVEAMFPNDARNSFWVSLRDDGSRQDGFAEYLCLALHEQGMPKGDFVVIRIWDAGAMARNEMEEIGRFDCQLR